MRFTRISLLLLLIVSAVAESNCTKKKERTPQDPGVKMQDFVIGISDYAKKARPGFIIIPQNGAELAFDSMKIYKGVNERYLNAIDAFGIEELLAKPEVDSFRVNMLRQLKELKPVLVSEYIEDDSEISDVREKLKEEDFIAFIRQKSNYNYQQIPGRIYNENTTDIEKISLAKNYLYLINSDEFEDNPSFIEAVAKTNYDMIIVDLFHNGVAFTSEEIEKLQTKANGGKRLVIAYLNIGSAEKWRYYWQKNWKMGKPVWIKKKYEGYDNEFYVNYWQKDWQEIIYGNDDSYLKKIIDAGFDGAYLDNVEAYYFLFRN